VSAELKHTADLVSEDLFSLAFKRINFCFAAPVHLTVPHYLSHCVFMSSFLFLCVFSSRETFEQFSISHHWHFRWHKLRKALSNCRSPGKWRWHCEDRSTEMLAKMLLAERKRETVHQSNSFGSDVQTNRHTRTHTQRHTACRPGHRV